MRKRIDIQSILFVLGFALVLLFPLRGGEWEKELELSGVSAEQELLSPTYESVMDGSYQASLNTWVENNFPGRKLLIKTRSQLMYSLMNESPNENVIIGS